MNCPTGKRLFDTQKLAEEALLQHHIRHYHRQGGGPVNVYECEDCGAWHFTSKGARSALFSDPEVKKRMEREKQEWEWEQRLK